MIDLRRALVLCLLAIATACGADGGTGDDVTIPLAPSTSTVPTAQVSGTIAGWNSLPTEPFGHYTLGLVLASYTDDVAGPENTITQPAPGGQPANTCLRSALSNDANWS